MIDAAQRPVRGSVRERERHTDIGPDADPNCRGQPGDAGIGRGIGNDVGDRARRQELAVGPLRRNAVVQRDTERAGVSSGPRNTRLAGVSSAI